MQRRSFGSLTLLAGALVTCAAVHAAPVQYVASRGNDANSCSITAPCRTLQHGIDTASKGGEVRVLDSGNFGAATIGKSLTLSAEGATIFGRITINAAGATVALRGLALNGTGTDAIGIDVLAAKLVRTDRCEVERFNDHGIYFAAPGDELAVTDSVARDNTGGAGLAIADPAATPADFGAMRLTVDDSRFENNGGDGLMLLGGTSTVTRTELSGNKHYGISLLFGAIGITSTVASHNGLDGFYLLGTNSTVEASISQDNARAGLLADADDEGSVTISNSVFANNGSAGIVSYHSAIATRGNNVAVGNGADVSGTLTPLPGT